MKITSLTCRRDVGIVVVAAAAFVSSVVGAGLVVAALSPKSHNVSARGDDYDVENIRGGDETEASSGTADTDDEVTTNAEEDNDANANVNDDEDAVCFPVEIEVRTGDIGNASDNDDDPGGAIENFGSRTFTSRGYDNYDDDGSSIIAVSNDPEAGVTVAWQLVHIPSEEIVLDGGLLLPSNNEVRYQSECLPVGAYDFRIVILDPSSRGAVAGGEGR